MSLESDISKIIQANGAKFYENEVVTENDETIYRIYITALGGVTLDMCAAISNDLSPFLDVNPPLSGHYRLEVSSPGIERKLTKLHHFQSAVGEKIKFKINGVQKSKGVLLNATNEGIVIATANGEESYEYNEVSKVKTYFDWNS